MSHHSMHELHKERMKFSAAHFTVFSATHRENLHGHNYQVYLSLKLEVGENGLSFDYRNYKQKLYTLCQELDETTLLAQHSPYLRIVHNQDYYEVYFAQEKLYFLKRDVKILPIRNITLEELSRWFVQRLTEDLALLARDRITELKVKVYSAPGQSGSFQWRRGDA